MKRTSPVLPTRPQCTLTVPARAATNAGLRRPCSPIAQLAEQRTVNPWVAGSNPARGATPTASSNPQPLRLTHALRKALRLPLRPRPPMRRKIDGMARARRHARFFRLQRTFWIAVLACTGHSGSSSDLCSDDRHPSIAYCATCPTQRKETFPFPLQPAFTAPNSPSYP